MTTGDPEAYPGAAIRGRYGTASTHTAGDAAEVMTAGNEKNPASGALPKVVLDQIVENAPALIYVKDPEGRYLYINKHSELVARVTAREALGKTDFDLFPAEVAAVYRKDDVRTLESMAPLRFEEPHFLQGAEHLFSTLKFPVFKDEHVLGVCGISVDITLDPHDPDATRRRSRADAFFGQLLASLTPQEVRVLDLVATGLSDREIAEKLNLSRDTVRHHVSNLLKKLRKRRGQVIVEMLKSGRA